MTHGQTITLWVIYLAPVVAAIVAAVVLNVRPTRPADDVDENGEPRWNDPGAHRDGHDEQGADQ